MANMIHHHGDDRHSYADEIISEIHQLEANRAEIATAYATANDERMIAEYGATLDGIEARINELNDRLDQLDTD